jgi:hypothetical protein
MPAIEASHDLRMGMTEQPIREVLVEEWRPMWRGMGVRAVAEQVMARSGPAVEERVWGRTKLEAAELWVKEEPAQQDDKERVARRRATVSFWLSIVAAFVSVLALGISAYPLLPKLWS